MNYKQDAIKSLAEKLKARGFRVFLAESETYGFFTNEEGTRIVSFQYDLGEICYSGNYKSKTCGTGWRLDKNLSHEEMISAGVPNWATRGERVEYTSLEQHLKTYQKVCRYKEIL